MRGITVTLYQRTKTGEDAANAPIYTETTTTVDNVLVGEPSAEDIVNELTLTGHRLAYTLAIPKGDSNTWTNCKVSFFGETFFCYAPPTQGIEDLIPLSWNKKVKVERYG